MLVNSHPCIYWRPAFIRDPAFIRGWHLFETRCLIEVLWYLYCSAVSDLSSWCVVCVCLCVCLLQCLNEISLKCVSVCICICRCVYVLVCLSVCLCVHVYAYVCVCWCACLSLSLCVCMPMYVYMLKCTKRDVSEWTTFHKYSRTDEKCTFHEATDTLRGTSQVLICTSLWHSIWSECVWRYSLPLIFVQLCLSV